MRRSLIYLVLLLSFLNESQSYAQTFIHERRTQWIRSTANFRTKQAGNYNDYRTWQIQGLNGTWYNTSYYPEAGNAITVAHAVSLTKNEFCNGATITTGSITYNGFSLNGTPLPAAITNIVVTYNQVQYSDDPITLSTVVTPTSAVTSWTWKAKNSSTGAIVDVSLDANPSFTLPPAYYDIELKASNPTYSWNRVYRHALRVLEPRFTEEEADVVIDVSSGGYFYNYSADSPHPGYKIGLKGTGSASINPYGLKGTSDHPARIQVLGNSDVTISCPPGAPHLLRFDGDVQYLIVDGSKDDGTIGLKLSSMQSSNAQTVMFRDKFTNVEVLKTQVTSNNAAGATAGATHFALVTGPSAAVNATNWAINDCYVMYCVGINSGQEGIYAGYNNDFFSSGYQPPKLIRPVFAWNSFTGSGRDGIQVGSAAYYEIHNNYIDSPGHEQTESNQDACFSLNGGGNGIVYANYAVNNQWWINHQSGVSPWDIYNGETTPKDVYIIGNIFEEGTHSAPAFPQSVAVFSQVNNATGAGSGHWNMHMIGNTVRTSKNFMAAYWGTSGFTSDKYTSANNIIVKTGTAGTYPELDITGPGTKPTVGQRLVNNLVRNNGAESDIMFTNLAGKDFTISSFSSTAYSVSTTNIASRFPELAGFYQDYLGFPMVSAGLDYTFGAYSGWQKRTIAPDAGDTNPATFTTPVSVTSLTQSGGMIGYESNKTGLLYYIISSVDVAPTKTQIRNGQLASGVTATLKGSVADVGTVVPKTITGCTESTTYYLFSVFVTIDHVEQSSVTRVQFTTSSDITPPTLSLFSVTNTNTSRIYFTSSEPILASGFTGFTISTKTISAIHIESGLTTGHYFTVTSPFIVDDALTIAYSGSGTVTDASAAHNSLASFGATSIANAIPPAAAESFVLGTNSNVTLATNNITQNGSTTGGASATKVIPSGSAGYIRWDYNANSRSTLSDAVKPSIGFLAGGTTYTYAMSQFVARADLDQSSGNVAYWVGSGTFINSRGGTQASGVSYQIVRLTDASTVKYQFSFDGGVSWTDIGTISGLTGTLRPAVYFNSGDTGKGFYNISIQANKGLQ